MFKLLFLKQLKRAMRDGLIPAGFDEGPINFAPTYKFDKGTDTYDTRYTSIWMPFILSLIPVSL